MSFHPSLNLHHVTDVRVVRNINRHWLHIYITNTEGEEAEVVVFGETNCPPVTVEDE